VSDDRHKSCSREQVDAEDFLVAALGEHLGIALSSSACVDGTAIDGFAQTEDKIVLAEAYAHIGRLRSGHKKKLDSDLLKLVFCRTKVLESSKSRTIHCYLVFADSEAEASYLAGWRKAAVEQFDVRTFCAPLAELQREDLLRVQARQRMTNV
jgi:hypothetical protein